MGKSNWLESVAPVFLNYLADFFSFSDNFGGLADIVEQPAQEQLTRQGKEKIIYSYVTVNMKCEVEIIGNPVLVAVNIRPFQLSAAVGLNLKAAACNDRSITAIHHSCSCSFVISLSIM